jgi:hypothetical protein
MEITGEARESKAAEPGGFQLMSTQPVYTRSVKTMILGFLGFGLAAAALAFADKFGYLNPPAVKRFMGLIIGVMIVITGNFLPKTRPLNAPGVNPPGPAAAAERFAGWVLVVAGIAYVGLFVFAPLDQARKISSIIGIVAMIYVAASWAWMMRGAVLGGREESPVDQQRAGERRKLMLPLLLAFFYAIATASAVFLLPNRRLIEEVSWWLFLGFWLLYSALMVALDRKRWSR